MTSDELKWFMQGVVVANEGKIVFSDNEEPKETAQANIVLPISCTISDSSLKYFTVWNYYESGATPDEDIYYSLIKMDGYPTEQIPESGNTEVQAGRIIFDGLLNWKGYGTKAFQLFVENPKVRIYMLADNGNLKTDQVFYSRNNYIGNFTGRYEHSEYIYAVLYMEDDIWL